ncbi:phosphate regulon sensor histidine kinase PhoR [Propionivibrio dicarboxylicus]|uniref:Phosphate regulon sensor protein PhoR n=1 Tax=Propionivibrio dicarboxylicus TaxID=83767 RepID=A0A1G7V6H6_9RHOO|nr:phosphate regulon sensor histidine kinase PhoR [Propionivibrio dicarboxylicus]SDG55366.1 two-component system, OmpR family, phosphate regulon sensor histidine kinase PhoR [Propionivibrio dicarboxylicus]
MRQELIRTLLLTTLAGCVALLAALVFSATVGWLVFCAGLMLQMLAHFRNFALLDRWSRAPEVDIALEGRGAWDGVFGRLYRHEKDLRALVERRNRRIDMLLAAIQALNDGVVLLDRNDQIVFCNATSEALLGLRARTDIGQSVANIVRQPEFVAYLTARDLSRPLILRSERNPGQVLSIQLISYADQRTLVQIKDVTQTDRLDRMRRDFVANVSHELRTPLTVLSGFLETLREIELTPDERQHYLALMSEQSGRMLSVVQDLLTLSSIEAAPPPEDGLIDMARILDKLRRDAESLSAGRHRIVVDADDACDLLGGEHELVSALSNLVSNAIRYTPAGGTVTIRWHANAQGGVFAVEDTGIGIEAQHIPRLTERFYRVDRGRSREAGGTGLGLAIVKHSLNRHQALLDISSTPGVGSCFAARFPGARVVTH